MNAIHIANNDGVTYVNVYRRSLSSGPNTSILAYSSNRGPQGLRRPRFSFFIFTCQTARGSKTPLPSPGASISGILLPAGRSFDPHSTANDNRLLSAVDSLILMRSFTGTTPCLGQGPKQRRAQWPVYKPPRSALSTVLSTNRLAAGKNLGRRGSLDFKGSTPYLSHNPATF